MASKTPEPRPELLPFDPAQLTGVRVRPSEFSRMVGVSRQTVSDWIKRGTIERGPDGRLDPVRAARQVMERTDPARLRARVFRQALASHDELRARVRELEAELQAERESREWAVSAALNKERDAANASLEALCEALATAWGEGSEAAKAGTLPDWLDDLAGSAYYGLDMEAERVWQDHGDDADDTAPADGNQPLPLPEAPE